jgi:hypothetical protein
MENAIRIMEKGPRSGQDALIVSLSLVRYRCTKHIRLLD